MSRLVLTLAYVALAFPATHAGTLFVDGGKGADTNSGRSPAECVRTIQRGADLARPGDEVIIAPGVYRERIFLAPHTRGEPGNPITFRADRIAPGRVILTGADRALREGGPEVWELVDASLGLYSAPLRGRAPARVLYDNVDLYPYGSLEELKTFNTTWKNGSPGPRHGFYHDAGAGRLYVRLHASRYGDPDPRRHVMAVGPDGTTDRIWNVSGKGPAFLVIEGITFETPGDAAIYTEASAITVRDCWFFGCPYAVRGSNRGAAREPDAGPWDTASEITIEHCEMTDISTFDDACEILAATPLTDHQRAPWSAIWHRKTSGRYGLPARVKNYENGIAVHIGRGWTIRHNFIHDIFEGLANDGATNAVDLTITDNVFARICDNAIETEDHSRDVRIARNLFLDVFEPFSWQPLDGPPWAGPIFFYQNVIANTPRNSAIWQRVSHERGIFKLGISLKNWKAGEAAPSALAAPAPGLLFVNNTIWAPGSRLITLLGSRSVPVENVVFARNLIATDFLLSLEPSADLPPGIFVFRQNLVAPATAGLPGPGSLVAGAEADGGKTFADTAALGLPDPAGNVFLPLPDSPANSVPGPISFPSAGIPVLPSIGAIQPGDTWFPPTVGPRITP